MRSIVRNKEVLNTQQANSKKKRRKQLPVPYRQILTDPIMWIVLFTFWSDELGFLIFSQYGPIYLNKAKFQIENRMVVFRYLGWMLKKRVS